MKKCFKCLNDKPLTDFYRHSGMSDGHLGKCKSCAKSDVISNRSSRSEYYKDFDRRRSMLPHRVEMRMKWRVNHPNKQKAHNVVNIAIENGTLKRKPCEICGTEFNVHGHHEDYDKPLEVIWLCASHHRLRHSFLERQT